MDRTKERARRRQRGSLTRQQIVEAALALADRDGIEALTMPALAASLECGVMTLYGYIESKEELLAAIALQGLRDLRLPRPLPKEPPAVLMAWGRALRATMLRHPSMAMIFLSRTVVGEGIFRGIEALLGALGPGGLAPAAGVHAIYAVVTYVTGFVAWEIPRTQQQPPEAYAAEWRRAFAGLAPADFPLTGTVLADLTEVASEEQFEVGLAALAAGLSGSRQPL
jgi:TetR/AcrR family transcriptional regulator, tetracycline repressor protein